MPLSHGVHSIAGMNNGTELFVIHNEQYGLSLLPQITIPAAV